MSKANRKMSSHASSCFSETDAKKSGCQIPGTRYTAKASIENGVVSPLTRRQLHKIEGGLRSAFLIPGHFRDLTVKQQAG